MRKRNVRDDGELCRRQGKKRRTELLKMRQRNVKDDEKLLRRGRELSKMRI
jgi:hypothetical protein